MSEPSYETTPNCTLVRYSGSTLVLPRLQLIPEPSITVATTLKDKELANVVRHEYKDQELTPAMQELLRRAGV